MFSGGCGGCAATFAAEDQTLYVIGTYNDICGCDQKTARLCGVDGLRRGLRATVSKSSQLVNSNVTTGAIVASVTTTRITIALRTLRVRGCGVGVVTASRVVVEGSVRPRGRRAPR